MRKESQVKPFGDWTFMQRLKENELCEEPASTASRVKHKCRYLGTGRGL